MSTTSTLERCLIFRVVAALGALVMTAGCSSPAARGAGSNPDALVSIDAATGLDTAGDLGADQESVGALDATSDMAEVAEDVDWMEMALDAGDVSGMDGAATDLGGGDGLEGDSPPDASIPLILPPRLLAPLSAGRVSNRRPSLHWVLPDGVTRATAQVCADRPCARVLGSWTVTGSSVRPTDPLAPGIVFWRVQGLNAAGAVVWTSATWEFEVPHRDAPVDTSWGVLTDFNNDGFDDAVVSEPGYNGVDGIVYVYPGSALGISATPAMTLPAPLLGAGYGSPLSIAGDVNGDGFADVLVGAIIADSPHGLMAIFQGSSSGLSPTASLLIPGTEGALEFFPRSASNAGDVNGDGYSDVVAGSYCSPYVTSGPDFGCGSGVAYLFLGGPSGLNLHPSLLLTAPDREQLGWAVAGAGDVDGDGYADVLVGAPESASGSGGAYLYFGGPVGLRQTDRVFLTGSYSSARGGLGYVVASAGDVNGDGLSDFIITASDLVTVYSGSRVRTFSAPSQLLPSPDWGSYVPGQDFGSSDFAPGDLNGDGYCDLAIGEVCNEGSMDPSDPAACGGHGLAYVYLGSSTGIASASVTTLTSTTAFAFGAMTIIGGDLNGDGYEDLMVGAPGRSGIRVGTETLGLGQVVIFNGSMMGVESAAAIALMSGLPDGYFGDVAIHWDDLSTVVPEEAASRPARPIVFPQMFLTLLPDLLETGRYHG